MITTEQNTALRVDLGFRLGDTWAAPEAWSVLYNEDDIDLAGNGWVVTAQARTQDGGTVLAEWSTTNGRVLVERAMVDTLDAEGNVVGSVETDAVRIHHSAADSEGWAPFVGVFDCQITHGDPSNPERYTLAEGTIRARRDVTR